MREPVAFARGTYEGIEQFDDVYTRMLDAMMDRWQERSVAGTAGGPLDHCRALLDAALPVLQQRAYEAIEAMDRQQAETDRGGDREVAWFWSREDLECHVLGLPGGPHVTVEDSPLVEWIKGHGPGRS